MYLGLGLQLQKQIEELNENGNTAEAQRVGQAFVAFLDKLNERGTTDPTVARWIAQTYYKLAEGLAGDPAATDVRAQYYGKARDAFRTLVNTVENPQLKLGLQVQYAQSLRQLQEFSDAMREFEQILTEKEMMLDVQKAAAYTLQEWGASADPTKLDMAVSGTGPKNERGKHIVWGWSYLGSVSASVARTRPEYKTLFYECWLNQSRVRYLKGVNAAGPKKGEMFSSARGVVKTMVTNYSDFLNTPLRDEFDVLMKEIQVAEGKRPTGLEELGVKPNPAK